MTETTPTKKIDGLPPGPVPVASCLTEAADAGLSPRTLYEARRRLPIVCVDRVGASPGWWKLDRGDLTPPQEWKRRKLPVCAENLIRID
jgi:hypothetical protein